MVLKGYLTGIAIVCFAFLIRAVFRKYKTIRIEKKKSETTNKGTVPKTNTELYMFMIACILAICVNVLYIKNKITTEYNTNTELYEENGLQSDWKIDPNIDSDDDLTIIKNKILDLEDEIDELKNDEEEEIKRLDRELYINGIGTIVVPILMGIFNAYSKEIKKKIKKLKGKKDKKGKKEVDSKRDKE